MADFDSEHERRLCLETAWSQVRVQGDYRRAGGVRVNEWGLRAALWRLMVGSHSR